MSRRPITCGRSTRATATSSGVLLEDARRHAHRQSRRGDLAQLPVLRDAGQLSGRARRDDRQGTVARRDRRLRRAVLLDPGADRRRQPRAGRHRQRSRHARVPAVVRRRDGQAAVEVLHGADEPRRSGARHVAEPRGGAPRRRSGRGCPAPTIPRRGCTSSAPAIRRPATPASRARATTCSPAR